MKLLWLCVLAAPVLALGPGGGNLGGTTTAGLGGLQTHGTGANLGFGGVQTIGGGSTIGLGGQTGGLNVGTKGLGGNLAGLQGSGLISGQGVGLGGQTGLGHLNAGQTSLGHVNVGQTSLGHVNVGQTGLGHVSVGQTGLGHANVGQTSLGHLNVGQTSIGGLSGGHGVALGGQGTILGGGGLTGVNAGFGAGQGVSVHPGQSTSLAGGLGHGFVGQQGVGLVGGKGTFGQGSVVTPANGFVGPVQVGGGLGVGNTGFVGDHGVSVTGLNTGIVGNTGGFVTQGNVGVSQKPLSFVTGHSGFTGGQGVGSGALTVTGGQTSIVGGKNIGLIGDQDVRFRTSPGVHVVSHHGDNVHHVGLDRKNTGITVVRNDFGGGHIVGDGHRGKGGITLVKGGGVVGGGGQRGVTIIRSKDGLGAFDNLRGLEVGGRDVSVVRSKGLHRGSLDVVRGGFRKGLRSRVVPVKGVRVASSLGSHHGLTQIHPSSGRSSISFNLGHGGRRGHKLGKGAIIVH